ncbi:hypothetical protein AC578_2252 [Pseudocercospora eumusae]|uniref:Protein kinase domain-containing protein n=1 Tax=Pseudocercospora eumusae TaxID=321146 RepID=A0A139GTP8_9PEZI|nr:hypothetical protein AC578_2252 [Pseudocercospora eumusae]
MDNTRSTAQTSVQEQYSSYSDGEDDAKELRLIKDNNGPHPTIIGEKQQQLADSGGNPPDEVSDIRSKRDLTVLCEVEDAETGAFLHLRRTLKRIPDEQIYPRATPSISILPHCRRDEKNLYIKRPQLTGCDDAEIAALLPGLLLEEARLLEILKIHPHPNLIKYHGCTLKNGRISGIALEKHEVLLLYRYEDRPLPFNTTACMDGIRAGVRHLHSLGLAHNDLNPMNVLLDKDDQPVIIDFGSCKKFGERLVSAGTPGWIDDEYIISARENDEAALLKIESWLAARGKEYECGHGDVACGTT